MEELPSSRNDESCGANHRKLHMHSTAHDVPSGSNSSPKVFGQTRLHLYTRGWRQPELRVMQSPFERKLLGFRALLNSAVETTEADSREIHIDSGSTWGAFTSRQSSPHRQCVSRLDTQVTRREQPGQRSSSNISCFGHAVTVPISHSARQYGASKRHFGHSLGPRGLTICSGRTPRRKCLTVVRSFVTDRGRRFANVDLSTSTNADKRSRTVLVLNES